MSEEVKFLYVSESKMPDCVMVGSIARSRADDMVRYVPERTCEILDSDASTEDVDIYKLSCGCAATYMPAYVGKSPSYCPYCGAKAVGE